MRLFKCELKCKIKGFPDRIEYLRAYKDEDLSRMFEECEQIESCEYYGYVWQSICPMKITDFPEINMIAKRSKK